MWPATTTADASTMPGQARGRAARRGRRRRPFAAPRAHRADRRAAAPGSAATAPSATQPTAERATSGIDERTGDGSTSSTTTVEHDLHDLAGGAFPGDRAQAPADVADVAPCRTPRCTSPSTPPGSVVLRNCDR